MKALNSLRGMMAVAWLGVAVVLEVGAQSTSPSYGMPTTSTTDAFGASAESSAYRSFARQGALAGPSSSSDADYSILFGFLDFLFDLEDPLALTPLEVVSIRVEGGEILMRVLGTPGASLEVDRSLDLNQWEPFDDPTLGVPPQELRFPLDSERVFYRFRYAIADD